MPPRQHAILGASSAHRWLNCGPSARLEQDFEDRETEAAAEGTAAHDELIIECDPEVSLEVVSEQMGRTPPWTPGLILRADGDEMPYYMKT